MPQLATRRRSPNRKKKSYPTPEKHYRDLLFVTATLVVLLILTRCGLDTVSGRIVLVAMLAHRCTGNHSFKNTVIAFAFLSE